MRKYIDAEDITSTIRKVRTKFAIDSVFGENLREDAAAAGALEAVAQVIDILPAADVVEVKHGRWEYTKELYRDPNGNHLFYGKICSECGSVSPYDSPYCMNCGADMQPEVTLANKGEVEE